MPAPFLIAGPCAAENQTQVVETARQVVSLLGNTVIFRAGLAVVAAGAKADGNGGGYRGGYSGAY